MPKSRAQHRAETQLQGILLDPEWMHLLEKHSWRLNAGGYVCTHYRVNGVNKVFYIHRVIMNAPAGLHVDHINHNKMDNRAENLRVVTRSQNSHNRLRYPKGSYRYRNGRWCARYSHNRRIVFVGYFKTADQAQEATERHKRQHIPGYAAITKHQLKET